MSDVPRLDAMVDVEVFPNWYYVCAADADGNVLFELERWQGEAAVVRGKMPQAIGTYNGMRYDLVVLHAIRRGAEPREVYLLSSKIVASGGDAEDSFDYAQAPRWRPKLHVDVACCVNYGVLGLKSRAANLHFPTFEMMPADPDRALRSDDAPAVKHYCLNDVMATWHCYHAAASTVSNLAAFERRGVPRITKHTQHLSLIHI